MEENNQEKHVVNNFEAGANCQVFNGNITGCTFAMPGSTVYQMPSISSEPQSDEQVDKALTACIGDDKVINCMRKWAGAYWCLRWKCGYPVDIKEFCVKIDSLKLAIPDALRCDYNNIRRFCKLSFMEYNPFGKAEVKVSAMDRDVYSWCREVALKIAEELEKTHLPQV